jgi:hypothetical protein
MKGAMKPPDTSRGSLRNDAVDFFRGLGLWMVFVDHLHPNFWSHFTLAQLGFCDFAEIFVFLSGYINAGMYERALHSGGIVLALKKLRTRVARLYVAHVATMAASFAILAALAARGLRLNDPIFHVWMENPARYVGRTLLLLYCPDVYSLFPLYILLAPFTLAAIVALRRRPVWTLAVSCALWCAAQSRSADLHIMTTREGWFFRPLAWQFLFVIGAASKMYWPRVRRVAQSRTVRRLAIGVVAAACLLKTAVLIGPAQEWLLQRGPFLARMLAHDAGKARLAPFRIVHFLGLLILILAIPDDRRKWLQSRVGRLAIGAGRDSLFIYSVTLVLTVALNLCLMRWDGGPLVQLACTALGLGAICGIAHARSKVPAKVVDLQPEEVRK